MREKKWKILAKKIAWTTIQELRNKSWLRKDWCGAYSVTQRKCKLSTKLYPFQPKQNKRKTKKKKIKIKIVSTTHNNLVEFWNAQQGHHQPFCIEFKVRAKWTKLIVDFTLYLAMQFLSSSSKQIIQLSYVTVKH